MNTGDLFCTVCAFVAQPPGAPCKLCKRTDAPERLTPGREPVTFGMHLSARDGVDKREDRA